MRAEALASKRRDESLVFGFGSRIEDHGDFGGGFRAGGRKLPLTDRFLSALSENGAAAKNFCVADGAVRLDEYLQADGAANTLHFEDERILHRNLPDDFARAILGETNRHARNDHQEEAEISAQVESSHVLSLTKRAMTWDGVRAH